MPLVLLDTDHISLMDRGGLEGGRILARLARMPPDDFATTIVTYEEQIRGWLAISSQARTEPQRIGAFQRLKRHLFFFCKLTVVDYDGQASELFVRLRNEGVRVKTKDLQIAAIALANNATLLTRNLSDFGKVPGLRVEDWSA